MSTTSVHAPLTCNFLVTACSFLFVVATASAQTIDSIVVLNTSTPNSTHGGDGIFMTQMTVGPVAQVANTSSFTYRMALYTAYDAAGGVAQTYRTVPSFNLRFRVLDPANLGFELTVDSLLRNLLDHANLELWQPGSGYRPGLLQGVWYLAGWLPDVQSDRRALSQHAGRRRHRNGQQNRVTGKRASASLGSYIGSTSFDLRFDSIFTPTTNIFFQNGGTGSGHINYGLGGAELNVDPAELGNFLTIKATYALNRPPYCSQRWVQRC